MSAQTMVLTSKKIQQTLKFALQTFHCQRRLTILRVFLLLFAVFFNRKSLHSSSRPDEVDTVVKNLEENPSRTTRIR